MIVTDDGSGLRFDRATYGSTAETGVPCAKCKGSIGDAYWKWQRQIVCARCREELAKFLDDSQSQARLGKAILLGGATALGCGIAYAVFVATTRIQFALATIGIAFVIARVVRKASAGIGGRRFQAVAVALTYVAATMGYLPGIWAGLQEASAEHRQKAAATSESGDAGAPQAGDARPGKVSAIDLVVAVGWLIGIMLAAPFLEAANAPLGLLIVGFGLWEAWKLSRGPPLQIEGPYAVTRSGP
jgi:hypothetical protein